MQFPEMLSIAKPDTSVNISDQEVLTETQEGVFLSGEEQVDQMARSSYWSIHPRDRKITRMQSQADFQIKSLDYSPLFSGRKSDKQQDSSKMVEGSTDTEE